MNSKNNKHETSDEKPVVIRNTTDLQRLKLEKLMKNPEKPVLIPERPKGRSMPPVPDFVRNVMGSSAGAGSGEFHVYRHLRRKEYARQKFIQEKSEREKMDDDYHYKLEENKRILQDKTAKNRAKRQKRKIKVKENRKKKVKKEISSTESSELDETDEEKSSDDDEKGKNDTNVKKVQNTEDHAINEDKQCLEIIHENTESLVDSSAENTDITPTNLNNRDMLNDKLNTEDTITINEIVRNDNNESIDLSNADDSINTKIENVI